MSFFNYKWKNLTMQVTLKSFIKLQIIKIYFGCLLFLNVIDLI